MVEHMKRMDAVHKCNRNVGLTMLTWSSVKHFVTPYILMIVGNSPAILDYDRELKKLTLWNHAPLLPNYIHLVNHLSNVQ